MDNKPPNVGVFPMTESYTLLLTEGILEVFIVVSWRNLGQCKLNSQTQSWRHLHYQFLKTFHFLDTSKMFHSVGDSQYNDTTGHKYMSITRYTDFACLVRDNNSQCLQKLVPWMRPCSQCLVEDCLAERIILVPRSFEFIVTIRTRSRQALENACSNQDHAAHSFIVSTCKNCIHFIIVSYKFNTQ